MLNQAVTTLPVRGYLARAMYNKMCEDNVERHKDHSSVCITLIPTSHMYIVTQTQTGTHPHIHTYIYTYIHQVNN